MRTTNKKTRKIKGGNAITSGGFGCLFKPALKCKNADKNSLNEKMVTKLMTRKNAKDEYKQISAFKSILKQIPNYRNYFLVNGFSICEPAELTKEDLEDFNENCDALEKKNFTDQNINQNLSKILALNMPDGGIDVDDYIKSVASPETIKNVYTALNNSLVNLLVNGIKSMNQLQLFHCDVKSSNILVQDSEGRIITRLIDWGLSIYRKNTAINARIPNKLDKRPFQFNVPFSVIIFNNKFLEKYNVFLKRHKSVNFFSIREFVINYIFYWNKIRGAGHLKTISSIIKNLTNSELHGIENKKVKNHVIEYEFTYYYIVEYISKILFKYTIDGKLNLLEYFNQIFLKNIDVWGLTMLYTTFLDNVNEVYEDKSNSNYQQFIEKIKYIIIHFLFENATEVIDINKLATELQSLNELIAKFDHANINEIDTKTNYFASLTKIAKDDIKEIGGNLHIKKRRTAKSYKAKSYKMKD